MRIYKVHDNPETAAKELPNFYLFESLDCAAAVLSQILSEDEKSQFQIPSEEVFKSKEFKYVLKYKKCFNWILNFAVFGCSEIRRKIPGYKYKYEDVILYLKNKEYNNFQDKKSNKIDFWPPRRFSVLLKRITQDSNESTKIFLCVYRFSKCQWQTLDEVPDWAVKIFVKCRTNSKYKWIPLDKLHFTEKVLDILPKKYQNRISKIG